MRIRGPNRAILSRRERGAALLVALLVLALLSSLAIGLYAIVRVERLAAINHLAQARAQEAAEAGVQRAIAELSASELDDPSGLGTLWRVTDPGTPIESVKTPSGNLGGTYVTAGDRFTVRVADTSAKLDLNARPDFVGPALDALGQAIAVERARTGAGPADPVHGRGATIATWIAARGGLSSVRELAGIVAPAEMRVLADFATVHAQRDPRTWRATGERDARGYPIVALDPRAPVCINTASLPVLAAVFANVTGRDGVPVSFEQALGLARWVVAWRQATLVDEGPFTTWDGFARLMDAAATPLNLTRAQKDAVLANASPNFMAGELNPDAVALSLGDAGALARGTTELALFTSGVYEIESLGRIVGPDDAIVAEVGIRAVARIFETARHTTQEDFAKGTCDAVSVLPAPGTDPAAPFAGFVQLALRAPTVSGTGALVPFSAGTATPIDGADPTSSSSACGHVSLVTPALTATTTPPPVASPQLAAGRLSTGPSGRLHADGLRIARTANVTRYGCSGTADHGSLALWLKLGLEETPGLILEAEQSLSDAFAVQSRLVAGRSGTTLSLDYERKLVKIAGQSAPAPTTIGATRTRVQLAGLGAAHEWHRIGVSWKNALDHTLSVDGRAQSGEKPAPLDLTTLDTVLASRDALAVGGGLDGTPATCDAVVDDLVLDSEGAPIVAPEDRYGQDGLVVGRFKASFDGFLSDVELGSFSWTAHQPSRWGAVSFQEDEFALLVSLSNQGTTVQFSGDGGPVRVGNKNGKGRALGWTKPKNPHAKSHNPVIAAAPVVDATNDLPRIIHSGGSIAYEFDFVFDRSSFAQRGLSAPPLAVSPILDDVSLTYTRGARVLRQEPLD